jgi:hypothetical protein
VRAGAGDKPVQKESHFRFGIDSAMLDQEARLIEIPVAI